MNKLVPRLLSLLLCLGMLGGCRGGEKLQSGESTEELSSVPSAESSAALSSSVPSSETAVEKTLEGTVYEATSGTITVEDAAGALYTFVRENVPLDAPEGILIGAAATVVYTGALGKDGDTSGAKAVRISVSPLPGIFAAYETRAAELAASMTPERKLAQLLMSATFSAGGDPAAQAGRDQPGGYVLFRPDFEGLTARQVRDKLAAMQQASEIPMLMAVDEEGGDVVRISSNPLLRETRFPSPAALCAEGMEAVQADTAEKAELLLSLGCNLLLAPVADVSLDEGDYIHSRTTGLSAEETAVYVATVVRSAGEVGLGTTLKHFPGYGNNLNTHTGISVDPRPMESFRESDFLPFQAGIDAGCPAVLVSHNIVTAMDAELPASLSPEVHRVLREELGFDGVILTDDLSMDAIGLYTGDTDPAVQAVLAGNDLLLTQHFEAAYAALLEGWQTGVLTEELLDRAVERILCFKMWLGLL